MNVSDLTKELAAIGHIYGRQITPGLVNAYHMLLNEYPLQQIREAIKAHCQSPEGGQWFPTPAHLIAQLEKRQHRAEPKQLAELAWLDLMECLDRPAQQLACGRVQAAVVHAMGGREALAMRTYDELKWTKRDFVSLYQTFSENPAAIRGGKSALAALFGDSDPEPGRLTHE